MPRICLGAGGVWRAQAAQNDVVMKAGEGANQAKPSFSQSGFEMATDGMKLFREHFSGLCLIQSE